MSATSLLLARARARAGGLAPMSYSLVAPATETV